MPGEYDAVIVGAGIIGAGIALEMSRRGRRTLNVDKLPAAGYGSTSNSCAIVRTHYSTMDGTALAWESYHRWKSWGAYLGAEDERGLAHLIETGAVVVPSEANTYEKHLAIHEELGIPFEVWSPETLAERVPYLDVTAFYPPRLPNDERFGESAAQALSDVLFLPRAGYVNDPQLATHNLQRAAEAVGAEFRFNEEVVSIERRDGRVTGVTLAGGKTLVAPVVVNAAGPHSFVVNAMAGILDDLSVGTRALRREVHYLPFPRGASPEGYGRLITDDDVGVYFRAEVGETMLVGSLDPRCDPHDWVDDPDDFNREVSDDRWKAQVYRAALRIPSLSIPGRPKGVVDLYDTTPDWIPIYDRCALDGFYLAVGTSGNQFKNAPVVGELMAELVEACEGGHDHDRDPVQVSGRYTGLTFDLGFYSRKREINRNSSFTVLG